MKLKKLTAVILAVSVAMSASGTVFADTAERETAVQVTDKDEGSIQAYSRSDTDIAYPVEGGNIYFNISTGEITGADKTITSANIPEQIDGVKVNSIGESAFAWSTYLTSITIPSSVTSIGNQVFGGCSSLTSITIPSSVTSIGTRAFYCCTSLTSITIPSSVTSIGYGTFSGCSSLTSITIPSSVTSIGEYVFRYCISLTDITIPSGVTSIGYGAFSGCSGLTSITIPDSVTSIGYNAFSGCSGLTSITIPNGVKRIEYGIFFNCSGLTSITIPDSVTSIGSSAFEDCSGLISITIPDSVTSIESITFSGCNGLTSITIPSSVTSIGYEAFDGCDKSKLIMYVEAGSYAEQWAKDHGFMTSTDKPTETTETTTETTTEPATEYVTIFGKAYTPDAVITDGSNIIDYSRYADKEIIVHYNISNAEDTAGIYSYDTLINYNPDVVEMTGVYIPTSLENYATYSDDIGNEYLPYDKDTINSLMNMVPQATDDKYADLLTSPGAVNELTAAQLGRVVLSNSSSTSFKSGTLASFVFKVKGEGDTGICADFDYYGDNTFGVVYNPNIVTSFESLPANIIVKDIDDELNNNGNINLDESISANDAAMLLQKALDMTFKTPCEEAYPDTYISISDVNGDGIITAADSASILQRALDSSYKFAID